MGINPTYYAEGKKSRTYKLKGSGFRSLPEGTLGIMATNNDAPLENLNNERALMKASVTVVSDIEAIVRNGQHTFEDDNYLGCIVSADRQTIYWVNETRPLPEE